MSVAFDFEGKYQNLKLQFENFLESRIRETENGQSEIVKKQFNELSQIHPIFKSEEVPTNYRKQISKFSESIYYSLCGEGKRFRPVLALATAELLSGDTKKVLPWALAIEMVHTYSLIHDDLPCMDNDDFRRGKPTNHKVFGESTALLSGDALLTESFYVAAECKNSEVVKLLSESAGVAGMIGGQVVDLATQKTKVSAAELALMQYNKTGALMKASVKGAAILSGASRDQIQALERFSTLVGLAFQVADDILDLEKDELGSFVTVIGLDQAKELLASLTSDARTCLESFEDRSRFLTQLVDYNASRTE